MSDPGVTLVVGASGGIGAALVSALSRRGDRVVGWDLRDPALAGTEHHRVDVTVRGEVDAGIERIERDVGALTGLAYVAGTLVVGPIGDLDDTAWDRAFAVNVVGLRNTARAAARPMSARRRGTIVTVASNAARVPRIHMSAYAASKAAAVMFSKCLGLELAPHVRCNVVSPGSTDTAMQRAYLGPDTPLDASIAGNASTFRTGIPLGRIAAPCDVAAAVVFLLSDDARHITLADLCVDGGATLGVG